MSGPKKFLLFSFVIYACTLIYSCSLQRYPAGKHLCLYGYCVKLEAKDILYPPQSEFDECKTQLERIEWLKTSSDPFGSYDICDFDAYQPMCPCHGLKGKINE